MFRVRMGRGVACCRVGAQGGVCRMRPGCCSCGWRRAGRAVARVAACVSAVALLAACTLDSEKPELALDTPGKYRWARGQVERSLPALDWWRGFRSVELTSLMEFAQAANLDIAVAIAQIEQADALVRVADASLFPLINFNSSASQSKSSSAIGSGGGGGTTRLFSSSLSASYIL